MSSRRAVLSVLLGLIALPGAGARAADAPADSSGQTLPVLEQVVATVDDEVVLLGEIVADVQYHALQQGAMPSPAEQRELLQEARDRRIEEKLLVAKAKRDQIQIGDEDLTVHGGGQLLERTGAAGGQHDRRAPPSELAHDLGTQAPAGTGDQDLRSVDVHAALLGSGPSARRRR